jgi:hypothetical protein
VLHAGELKDVDDSCTCYIEDSSPFEVISHIASHPLKLLQFLSFFVEISNKNSSSYIAFSRNFSAENPYSRTSCLFLAQYSF